MNGYVQVNMGIQCPQENGMHRVTPPVIRLAPVLIIVVHAFMLAYSATCHSPVWDELYRLRAGYAQMTTGCFSHDPGNPPMADIIAAIPIAYLANPAERDSFARDFLQSPYTTRLIIMGRIALIPFSLIGGCVCYMWARDLYGRRAGHFALLLWCIDPMVIAHGALITGDVVATAAGTTAVYCCWLWMNRPSILRAVICGITVGIALLAKYLWVILPPLLVILWLARRLASPRPDGWPLPRQVALAVMAAAYVINAGYGFADTCRPWRDFQFESQTLQRLAMYPSAMSGLSEWLGAVPVPLPQAYVMGIDTVIDHVNSTTSPTYIHGSFVDGHVWYYYCYGLLVKVPLGTWAALAMSLLLRLNDGMPRTHRRPGDRECGVAKSAFPQWFMDFVLWVPAIAVVTFVSSVTSIKFLRYALPALPFAFIWSSQILSASSRNMWCRNAFACGCLSSAAISSVLVFPHSLSYFNEAAGGTARGDAHLLGPSFDYGQDLLFLKKWIDAHPGATPFYMACYGFDILDPAHAGLPSDAPSPHGPMPGWYAVSASVLRGAWRVRYSTEGALRSDYRYLESLRDRAPVDRVAYSIFIYHLDCDQANAMRAKLGLELIECGESRLTVGGDYSQER